MRKLMAVLALSMLAAACETPTGATQDAIARVHAEEARIKASR